MTESKQGVTQTPKAPTPETVVQFRKVVEEGSDTSGAVCRMLTCQIQPLRKVSASTSVQVTPLEETPFPAPGEQVTKFYPDGLLVERRGGINLRKVKFTTLPEFVRRQDGYDAQKAAAYEAEQARAAAECRANELRRAAQAGANQIAEDQAAPHEGGERVTTLSQIVSDYCRNHTYSKEDWFVCTDMACDVWNMVKTKGIPAKIQVGNVQSDIDSLSAANHAWVLAEASPGKWVALEATAGRLVYADENPRYYRGWSFDNPRKLKESLKP